MARVPAVFGYPVVYRCPHESASGRRGLPLTAVVAPAFLAVVVV
jgi:hypothetical protein